MSGMNGVTGTGLLTLRIKCKKSQSLVMRGVSPDQLVNEFLAELHQLTSVPVDKMALLKGFPPSRVFYTLTMTVGEIGIIHQDTIIVEVDATGNFPGGSRSILEEVADTSASPLGYKTQEAVKGPVPDDLQEVSSPTSPAGPASPYVEGPTDEEYAVARSPGHISIYDSGPKDNFPIGILLRKVVPSDNSCLFTALQFVLNGSMVKDGAGRVSPTASKGMREMIARTVKGDPVKYSEAFLGRTNSDYFKWIQKYESWGGGIELAILSQHYQTEINVMDTQHMRMNRFGEDQKYRERVYLIYDGIHYDALYLESYDGATVTTKFAAADSNVYDQVMELGREAKACHQFTDLQNFTLMCSICNVKFVGQVEAQAHAKETKHASFVETT